MNDGYQTFRLTGCPIRIFPDPGSLTAPRDFSQFATSFLALQCLGIHRMLLHTSTYFSCARSRARFAFTLFYDYKDLKNLMYGGE
jgi:hypothetical protein